LPSLFAFSVETPVSRTPAPKKKNEEKRRECVSEREGEGEDKRKRWTQGRRKDKKKNHNHNESMPLHSPIFPAHLPFLPYLIFLSFFFIFRVYLIWIVLSRFLALSAASGVLPSRPLFINPPFGSVLAIDLADTSPRGSAPGDGLNVEFTKRLFNLVKATKPLSDVCGSPTS
jgi:hypothetical protein